MKKEKITLPIGGNKALIFECDPSDMEDQDFAKRCIHVAAGKPPTIQDFFIRLNEEQKQSPEINKKRSRKI